MATQDQITVALLDPAAGTETAVADDLCVLVNDVYAVAEKGLWRDGMARTSPEELREMIAAGEILVAAPDQRGLGIGRALLDEVERRSRDRGLDAVQLELLVPRQWSHPEKEFLTSWYGRRGYDLVRTTTLDGPYPHLAPLLATPCDLQIRRNALR